MRWRLILEEYGPELRYIKGESNVVADALSRLDMLADHPVSEEEVAEMFAADSDTGTWAKAFPLAYSNIEDHQKNDPDIQKAFRDKKDLYKETVYPCGDHSYTLITKNDKIVLPKALQTEAVKWYHGALMHPGETRTELTMGQHFTWKGMRKTVQDVCKKCGSCQLSKPKLQKLGHLPEKEPEMVPWDRVCIDLIGPYKIGSKEKDNHAVLHCLTMIDPATGWFEITEIPAKTADVVMNIFEQEWLTRYPYPVEVVMDRGTEFMAEVKKTLRQDYGARIKLITTRNPQANSMVERSHQTIKNMIKSQTITSRDDLENGEWKGVLSAVRFAMRATLHTTMRATPMQLVYGRDAIHNIRFEADWQYIKARRQQVIRRNNERENAQRTPHTYQPGHRVMISQHQNRKYGTPKYKGPYTVDSVNDNGTLRLSVPKGNGTVYETWNIRNIHPYRD
jgi:hypothetical protein